MAQASRLEPYLDSLSILCHVSQWVCSWYWVSAAETHADALNIQDVNDMYYRSEARHNALLRVRCSVPHPCSGEF